MKCNNKILFIIATILIPIISIGILVGIGINTMMILTDPSSKEPGIVLSDMIVGGMALFVFGMIFMRLICTLTMMRNEDVDKVIKKNIKELEKKIKGDYNE